MPTKYLAPLLIGAAQKVALSGGCDRMPSTNPFKRLFGVTGSAQRNRERDDLHGNRPPPGAPNAFQSANLQDFQQAVVARVR